MKAATVSPSPSPSPSSTSEPSPTPEPSPTSEPVTDPGATSEQLQQLLDLLVGFGSVFAVGLGIVILLLAYRVVSAES